MNWRLMEALLARDFPSLMRSIRLPEGYVIQGGIDQDPPSIILLIGKSLESGRSHPLLGCIKSKLTEEDLAPLHPIFADVFRRFPRLSVKSKNKDGIFAYKLWIER